MRDEGLKFATNDSVVLVSGKFLDEINLQIDPTDSLPRFVSSGFGAREATLFPVHLLIVGILLVRAAS